MSVYYFAIHSPKKQCMKKGTFPFGFFSYPLFHCLSTNTNDTFQGNASNPSQEAMGSYMAHTLSLRIRFQHQCGICSKLLVAAGRILQLHPTALSCNPFLTLLGGWLADRPVSRSVCRFVVWRLSFQFPSKSLFLVSTRFMAFGQGNCPVHPTRYFRYLGV